ncbi:FmdB family zinc ribbon protein [Chloroflexota bacterium]
MPIYEYECTGCPCRFELRRSFSEDGSVFCPECGSEATRIFMPVPIIFKGSGFYVTDNRGNHSHSAPAESTKEDKVGSTGEGSNSGSTEKGD